MTRQKDSEMSTTQSIDPASSPVISTGANRRGIFAQLFEFFTGSPEVIAMRAKVRRERDEARGYTISVKQVVLAFAVEIVIIAASLIGAYHFAILNIPDADLAKQKLDFSNSYFVLGMLGQVGFAMVEMTRIPLALSIRFQTSFFLKVLAAIGVICAAGITAKSMVSLSQQMYEPRRAAVVKAKTELTVATKNKTLLDQQYENLLEKVASRKTLKDEIDASMAQKYETLRRNNCVPGTYQRFLNGELLTSSGCQNQALIASLSKDIAADRTNRVVAIGNLNDAEKEANAFFEADVKSTERERIKVEARYREAVQNSQLHSLASILLGKDMMELEDGDVSFLLRFFIYIPALLVAFASTMIAITAVVRIKKPEEVIIPTDSQSYLLGPITSAIVQRVLDELRKANLKNRSDIDESIQREMNAETKS